MSEKSEYILVSLDGIIYCIPPDLMLVNLVNLQENIDRLERYFQEGRVPEEFYDFWKAFLKQLDEYLPSEVEGWRK